MPNDPAGSFPLPPTDNQPPTEVTPEVKLTDEVAPDLSTPQPVAPEPVSPEPTPAPTVQVAPVTPEPAYQPPSAPMPAAVPASAGKHFPIVTLLLLLISIGAIAATYFFYQQSQALNLQLGQISKTLEQQRIKENQATITPTPQAKPDLASPDTSTISATPTATQSGGQATPTISMGNSTGLAFSNTDSIISLASEKYPGAQLILLVATGAESPASTTIKYWFRQTLTDKKYLYVLSEPGKALSVVDHPQLYVRADNNIPSLNQRAGSNGLGIDLPEAIRIAAAACPNKFDCTNSSIKAQYIDDLKLKSILWQISFASSSGKLFVVQINATTKKIIIQYF